jgi:replicative DNA helicase
MLESLEIERQVLGACLKDTKALTTAIERIPDSQVFSNPKHRQLFEVFEQVYLSDNISHPFDATRLVLEKEGKLSQIGGLVYLVGLVESIGSTSLLESWIGELLNLYRKRVVASACKNVIGLFSENGTGVTEGLQILESAIAEGYETGGIKMLSVADDLEPFVDDILSGRSKKKLFVSTGLPNLDKVTGGMCKGEVCVVAAVPSGGKTSFCIGAAIDNARRGRKTAFFALEETTAAIFRRLIIYHTGISSTALKYGQLTLAEQMDVKSAVSKLTRAGNIYICGKPGLTIDDIVSLSRREIRRHGLDLVIIDFAQKIAWRGSQNISRNYQLENISTAIKVMAEDLDVAVLLTSQFNREWSKIPDDQIPTMTMLRDSGSLEQDANLLIYPWVPLWFLRQKYGDQHSRYKDALAALKHEHPLAKMVVRKYKEGKQTTVDCRINEERMMFYSEYKEEGFL